MQGIKRPQLSPRLCPTYPLIPNVHCAIPGSNRAQWLWDLLAVFQTHAHGSSPRVLMQGKKQATLDAGRKRVSLFTTLTGTCNLLLPSDAQPSNLPCLQLEAFRRKKEAGSSRTQTPTNSAPASATSAAHDTAASAPQQQTAGQGSSQTDAGPASPPRPALHPRQQASAQAPSSESSPDRAGHSYVNGGLTGKKHAQADGATWFDNPVSAAAQSSPMQHPPPVSAGQAGGAGEQDGWDESHQGWDDLDLGLQGVERQPGKPVAVQRARLPCGCCSFLHVLCVQSQRPHRCCQSRYD